MFKVFFNNYTEITMYVIAAVVFTLLHFLARKRVNFSIRTLTAMAIGVVVGLVVGKDAAFLRPFGTIYIRLITALVIPLVTVSIIKSFTNLADKDMLRRIGLKSLFWLLLTTTIGATLGLVSAVLLKIGQGANLGLANDGKIRQTKPMIDVIVDLVPNNLINHAGSNQVIPIIIFAILISVAVIVEGGRHPERVKPFKDFIESFAYIMNRVTKMIIRLTPYAVFALIAHAAGRNDMALVKSLGKYILLIYVVMIVHFIIVHGGLISFVAKLNPVRYFKKVSPATVVAFTSQSSFGTLPVTIKSLTDRVGVSERIANFVGPLGAVVGMNACGGIFPAIVAIFVANAYGIELTMVHYITIIFTTTVASIGIAGVPGIATIAANVVLASVGLPLEGIAIIAGVDGLIDMGRTALNVTGTTVAATLVARSENELNEEIFNSDAPAEFSAN
jgi:uncharacterized protein